MNSTPPKADWMAFWVRGAVWPTYWPTRSPRVTSTSWPPSSTPMALRYRETMRATVVLPVPGLPVNIMCMEGESALRPRSRRSCWILKLSSRERM